MSRLGLRVDFRVAALGAAVSGGVLVVALTELLGRFHALTIHAVAVTWAVVLAAVVAPVWARWWRGQWRLPDWRPPCPRGLDLAMALWIAVVVVLTGLVALRAAPITYDSMTYHLARVAHWAQNRSVDFYPTHIIRQLYQPPWAEYALLHLFILAQGDRLANLVQWISMVASLMGISVIARQLGAGRRGQLLSAFVGATIPMGVLQAATTQNDHVNALWLVCLVSALLSLEATPGIVPVLSAGASLGLALLTKGTSYLLAAPFVAVFTLSGTHRPLSRKLGQALVIGLCALALNAPHYARNAALFGAPLGPGGEGNYRYANEAFRPAILISNALRNIALHLGTPSPTANARVEQAIDALHAMIGIAPDDARSTWPGTRFAIAVPRADEDLAPNGLHLLLMAGALAGAWRRRDDRRLLAFAGCLIAAFVLFCLVLRWQPWHSRLHLPLFVLAAPLIGVVLERLRPALIAIGLDPPGRLIRTLPGQEPGSPARRPPLGLPHDVGRAARAARRPGLRRGDPLRGLHRLPRGGPGPRQQRPRVLSVGPPGRSGVARHADAGGRRQRLVPDSASHVPHPQSLRDHPGERAGRARPHPGNARLWRGVGARPRPGPHALGPRSHGAGRRRAPVREGDAGPPALPVSPAAPAAPPRARHGLACGRLLRARRVTRLETHMISGSAFADALEQHGFDFFAGVPCSLIEDLIAVLQVHPRLPYVAAVREDVAIGLAAGAWLGGKRPAVLMQNSGLGTSLNALASLALMYGLPSLLVVTWRGHAGQDAPEHILMGSISPSLLDLLGIPHRVASAESLDADLAWAVAEMDARMQPVSILVPPGVVETGHAHGASPATTMPDPTPMPGEPRPPLEPSRISRLTALGAAVKELGDEPLIHANGYICRESFSIGDRPQNFYMIGSMGLAPAIGLGLALARPRSPVVVADGDGNLLMNLGILAQVGALQPANLVHCVFDNEVYGSTGNQRSPSRVVRLDRLAGAAGYRTVAGITRADEITAALRSTLATSGPHFILVKVTTEEAAVPRIPYAPSTIRDRFRASQAAR